MPTYFKVLFTTIFALEKTTKICYDSRSDAAEIRAGYLPLANRARYRPVLMIFFPLKARLGNACA